MVDERLGEREPALDGHGERHAAGAEAERAPEHAHAAKVRREHPRARQVDLQVHLDGAAGDREQVVPRQALEHERLALVARRLVAPEDHERARVPRDAEDVEHGEQGLSGVATIRLLRRTVSGTCCFPASRMLDFAFENLF